VAIVGAFASLGVFAGTALSSPLGFTAYVTDSLAARVTPINTATNTLEAPITVGVDPAEIAITPDGQTAYVTNTFDGTVTPINTATNTPDPPDKVGRKPVGIAITPNGQTVYATGLGAGAITPISTATNTAVTPIKAGPAPAGIAITPDLTPVAPSLTHLRQSHSRWHERGRPVRSNQPKRKQSPIGTTFSFTLDQPARVAFAFTQQLGGRTVGGRCVAQTQKNRHKPGCSRILTRGTLKFSGHTGPNKLAFEGRISGSRTLAPGRYTLATTATNSSAQPSTTRTLSFTIVN
jgi:YVTN family beta-propeller protein